MKQKREYKTPIFPRSDPKELAPESKRLDFVLDNLCFIQSKKTDSGTESYQLMSQNEDEEFFTLHILRVTD